MLFNVAIVAAFGLLLSTADAGSRRWQSGVVLAGRNETHPLNVRAISFQPSGGTGGNYVWPNKRIKYCYESPEAKQHLRGPLEAAMQTVWAGLVDLGFTYEEVDLPICEADRANHLKVFYNDRGKLATSIALQPVDEQWNRDNPDNQYHGPSMHLSTLANIGMLDPVANVAHELGHAWGLLHEHQNPNFWTTGIDDQFPSNPNDPLWNSYNGRDPRFTPGQFNCMALTDYQDALARAQALAAQGGEYADIERTFCSSQAHASKVGFSAKDWLPLGPGVRHIADAEFDPNSIMLYPSGAGGIRPGNNPDGRTNVLTLANGALMMPNVTPSPRDIQRLQLLYAVNTVDIQPVLMKSSKKGTFDKIKRGLKKFGSAKDQACQ